MKEVFYIKEDSIYTCKECGWIFPNQLVNVLLEKDDSIYCEKCGIENKKIDFGKMQISQIPQKIQQKTLVDENQQEKLEEEEETKNLRSLLSIAKKKSVEYKKKFKKKFKDLMD